MNCIEMKWIFTFFLVFTLSACSKHESAGLNPEKRIPIPTSSVVHYGIGIGVEEFYLNGKLSGHEYDGWGSSSETCCMSLPENPPDPLMVKVQWKTYRTSFIEERWHEAIVPIHFAVRPGEGYGLKVHFLPGHKVEIWYASEGTGSPNYPGPKYPFDPAPEYIPLPDESTEPNKDTQK